MTSPPGPPRPPALPVLVPGLADCARMVWWLEVGFVHGARTGGLGGRLLAAAGAVLWWPSAPLLLLGQLIACARPSTMHYLSPGRDAVLAVTVRRDGWHLHSHATSRPGRGRGRALRAAVLPALLAAADDAGVDVYAVAAHRRLAAVFAAEVPGLRDVGAAFPRGRRLHRPPQGTGVPGDHGR